MPQVPVDLEDCSTTERIAALLYLGWTHEEIAAAADVSKGTVQNRRIELEGGNLQPPPEVFDLIRTREREVHRMLRNTGAPAAAYGTEFTDRMKALADLEVLDIGPDGEISYEELVAFATLIAGQVAEFKPHEVVQRLAPIAALVDYPSDLSDSVFELSRQRRAVYPELNEDLGGENLWTNDDSNQVGKRADTLSEKSTTSWKDNETEMERSSPMPDRFDQEQQGDLFQADDQAAGNHEEPFRNKEPMDWEECWRRGLIYDEETGLCRENSFKFDDDLMD